MSQTTQHQFTINWETYNSGDASVELWTTECVTATVADLAKLGIHPPKKPAPLFKVGDIILSRDTFKVREVIEASDTEVLLTRIGGEERWPRAPPSAASAYTKVGETTTP